MLDIGALQEETCAFGDAFPNQVFHVVSSQHDQGFRILADGLCVRSHEKGLHLNHVVIVLLQHLDESVGEFLGDETLYMVRLVGEQVGKSLEGFDAQVHVDELDACLAPVVLRDVVDADIVLLAVDGKDLDMMPGIEEAVDDAVHGHGTAFEGRIGRFVTEEKYLHDAFFCVE